ncbi:MAG: alpha/beta fold hydrolase [Alphaproteobacteria bacterium]|nr:alpha/beta fold hydrolase [Alphaproteobacteria bacterium]
MRKILPIAALGLAAGLASFSAAAKPLAPDDTSESCPKDATCGVVMRPLDPSGRVKGALGIAYRLYRHTDANAVPKETIVAQEGGPGFASIKSSYGYKQLFSALRADHDLLIVDARGTGPTGIDCKSLQRSPVRTPRDIGACGRALGRASTLYGTRLAVDDMVAVLDALHIGRIDFYGDSYGTFFGQVLSATYPDRLRAVVLDGAYPVIGETPWYTNAGKVVRRGFDEACARAPYCAGLKGSSLARIRKLVDFVRRSPISGSAPDGEGEMRRVTVDPGTVGNMLYAGTQGPVNYRDLDAAIRAWFEARDARPLLRLAAESNANEDPEPPRQYSYGLFAAVSCMDYQQIYDMTSSLADRRTQRRDALRTQRASDPGIYDPLSIDEFQTVPLDISVLNLCLEWPVHHAPYTPGKPIPDGAQFTAAPTLVINGELDMLTTAAEGAIVTAQYPHGQQVVVANSFHVDAIDDYDDCASAIVRRFVATLDAGDTSCAAKVNPVRLVPFFALHAADALPAVPGDGNAATTADLAVASAAVQTAGDVIARWNINYSGHGVGLRGGRWRYSQPDMVARFSLSKVRWTRDLAVSGSAVWDQRDGSIRVDLTFANGRVTASWNDRATDAVASLSGRIGGRVLRASMPAP